MPLSRLRALRFALALTTALALGAAPGVATANEAADKAAATKLLREGNQLTGDGEHLAALEKFRAAHARYPSAKILLNIGTTLRQLGRNIEAAEAYERYLRDPKAEAGKADAVRRILKEIEAVIARVRVEVNEPGARVRLDGKELTEFRGVEVRVEAGEHTFTAEAAGFPPAIRTITLAPHEQRVLSMRLAPPEKVAVPVSGPQRPISFVVGGVGAASLLAGGVAGIVAVAQNHAASGHCWTKTVCDQRGVDLGKSAKTSALVSTVTLAVGGAALATGTILFFTAPRAPNAETPATTAGLLVSPRGAGFTVEGVF